MNNTEELKDKRIIYPNGKGGVAIVIPSPDAEIPLEDIIKRVVPKGVEYQVISVHDLPEDKEYRDAWTYEPISKE